MSYANILNVVSGVATVVSFGLAVVQTIRYRQAKANLEQLQRIKNADIWSGIALTLQAYETLDDARLLAPPDAPELSAKLSSARRSVVSQYINQLRQAVLDEPEFTEETVERWQRIGRLENDWRVAQARKFIRSEGRAEKTRAATA
jgi:hypothetical protein